MVGLTCAPEEAAGPSPRLLTRSGAWLRLQSYDLRRAASPEESSELGAPVAIGVLQADRDQHSEHVGAGRRRSIAPIARDPCVDAGKGRGVQADTDVIFAFSHWNAPALAAKQAHPRRSPES
jgi:hypothetical protein